MTLSKKEMKDFLGVASCIHKSDCFGLNDLKIEANYLERMSEAQTNKLPKYLKRIYFDEGYD